MNHYEAKQEARRERLLARAEKLRREGSGRIKRAQEIASGIPFGQPILVGHHSEGRHRSDLKRINNGYDKGYAALKAAGEAEARASNIGNGGISSDDPEAGIKLREELAKLQADQVRMKAANALIRKHKAGEGAVAPLNELLGWGEPLVRKLMEPDCCGRIGFASYLLTNNGANIRRIEQRIKALQAKASEEYKKVECAGGIELIENVEENRLQLIFPGKPAPDVIARLKSRGFRWAPSEGAWQRQLNNAARWAAQQILEGN